MDASHQAPKKASKPEPAISTGLLDSLNSITSIFARALFRFTLSRFMYLKLNAYFCPANPKGAESAALGDCYHYSKFTRDRVGIFCTSLESYQPASLSVSNSRLYCTYCILKEKIQFSNVRLTLAPFSLFHAVPYHYRAPTGQFPTPQRLYLLLDFSWRCDCEVSTVAAVYKETLVKHLLPLDHSQRIDLGRATWSASVFSTLPLVVFHQRPFR
jgi:hypothetical protein